MEEAERQSKASTSQADGFVTGGKLRLLTHAEVFRSSNTFVWGTLT
jgi:hypothetical protein